MQLIEMCLMSLGCGTLLDYSDAIAFLAGVVALKLLKTLV
jgi:hypothetical protein